MNDYKVCPKCGIRLEKKLIELATVDFCCPICEQALVSDFIEDEVKRSPVDLCYVTVGHPKGDIPILKEVQLYFDSDKETAVQVAKMMRKHIADDPTNYGYVEGTVFNPAELYYIVWEKLNTFPLAWSRNALPIVFKDHLVIAKLLEDEYV